MTTNNSIDAVGFPPLSVSLGGTNLSSTIANNILFSSATSVIGQIATANNGALITSAGGVPSISSTLPNAVQLNITNVGALSAGSLTTGFMPVPLSIGGTNANLTASNGGVFYSTATAGAILAATATANQVLLSGANAAPAWSTATYPATTAINNLLYSSATNVIANLATANNGVLVTSSAGVPSILAGSGVTGNILQSNAAAAPSFSAATYPSTTTINQILYSSATDVVTGLAATASSVLTYNSSSVPIATALAATQTIVGVAGLSPALASIPGINRLINSNFQVWQRGAGGAAVIAVPASTIAYTADRWQILTNANQACTVTQVAGAISGSYLAKIQRNSGQTGASNIRFGQSLTRDMCLGVGGSSVTISFKALAGANFSSASSVLTVALVTGTGTSDISGISAVAYTGNVSQFTLVTLTTTLTSFFVTFTAASNVTQLCVQFSYPPLGTAGADDSFSVTDAQVETSPNPTPYENKNFEQALYECKPFYQKSFLYGTVPAQNIGTGTSEQIFAQSRGASNACASPTIAFEVEMFATPTMTYFSPAAASIQAYDETATNTCTATATRFVTPKQVVINYTSASALNGGAAGNVIGLHWTAEAELN